jgi:hypothetical protein
VVEFDLPPPSHLPGRRRESGTRDIAAGWLLRSRIADAHGDWLVICPGTQNALFGLRVALTSPGEVVLTADLPERRSRLDMPACAWSESRSTRTALF